jgi:transposase-like protein
VKLNFYFWAAVIADKIQTFEELRRRRDNKAAMRFCSLSDADGERALVMGDALPSASAPNFAVLLKNGAAFVALAPPRRAGN